MFSADAPPRNCSSSLTESVCPVGRIRSIREVYDWEQTRSQALLIDVNHSTLGSITLPDPPLRFFDPDGTEVTRAHHLPPPVLGADNDTVAGWLLQGAVR
jgi:crotonobetainyl-CoA:carnitine CoA-transferase CaiB-like acyl-CoA transferase